MSEHALEMMKSEKLINRGEMLDLWDLARQEQDLEARADAVKAVNEIQESKDNENENESDPGEEKIERATKTKKELAEMADAAERAAKVSERGFIQKCGQSETQLKGPNRPRPRSPGRVSIRSRGSSKLSSRARIRARSSACSSRPPSWPEKSIKPPRTVTTSAANSARADASRPVRASSSGGASRETRNSANWRGWSGGSSRTRAR